TIPGYPECWTAPEWNGNGYEVANAMMGMGVYVHISRSTDQRKQKRKTYYGVKIDPHNKFTLITTHIKPEIDRSHPENELLPHLVVPFMGFWKECETFVFKYNEKLENRPEIPKLEAQTRTHKD